MLDENSAFQNEAFVGGEEPALATKTDDLVLLNTFLIGSKRHRVCYQTLTGRLVWEPQAGHKGGDSDQKAKAPPKTVTVPICDILCVKFNDAGDDSSPSHSKKWYLKVVYAKRKSEKRPTDKWRVTSTVMFNKDRRIIRLWFKVLDAAIKDKKTPKSLIVFVNPFGGERKALHVYERYAKPLFELAGIEVNCVISQRARQITDLIMSMRLDIYDGICCVGGDGTFSEVFNGLLQRSSQNGDNPTKPSLPIGIIPAGSTDTVAFCLHNTSDIQTCVLAIVLGSTRGLDLASVAGQDGLRKYYASMFSFGFLGDVAWDSENYRYLGKKRYDFSGFKIFLKNRGYSANVAILLDEEANNASYRERCLANCQHCAKATRSEPNTEVPALEDSNRWKTLNGKFFMINVANISCACHRSKNGVAQAHLADGFLDITLVRHTGFWNNLRLLMALKAGEAERLPFVENFRARRFHFRKLDDDQFAKLNTSASAVDGSICGDSSLANSTQQFDAHHFDSDEAVDQQALWNCDGEKVDCADLVVSSHLKLVRVFRRGGVGGDCGNQAAQTIALT